MKIPPDLTACDTEPVHLPGSVQPFGVLLGMTPDGETPTHLSENAPAVFGVAAQHLSNPLALFAPEDVRELEAAIGSVEGHDGKTPNVRLRMLGTQQVFEAVGYRNQDTLNIEVERADPPGIAEASLQRLPHLLAQLQHASSVPSLCSMLASGLRTITQHERVMVYRFHDDDHGEVIAEATAPGLEPFLGLHYPASDIPAPARRVFYLNWLRIIPDAHATPVPIHSIGAARGPLDLSRSLLRSVSPIHLEYLHNMGIRASLTLSIIHRGRLWGLITCAHHTATKHVPLGIRRACEVIAGAISALLPIKEETEIIRHGQRLQGIRQRLEASMARSELYAQGLADESEALLDLVDARGAAVYQRELQTWFCVGQTPSHNSLHDLARWLAPRSETVIATDTLPREYPPAESFARLGSGVLAISIPGDEPNFILWFRPERLETVSWGGDPHKAVADDQGRIHPRKSFSAWTETVKGISAPWQPWETAAASQLRNAILSLELRRQLHREQVARAEAERATRLQKELMSVVSHDLKNPLTSIRLNLSLLQNKISTDAPVKYRSLFDSLDAASERMRRLVDDLLDVAKMESEGLQLDRASHFATQLVNDAIQIVEPIAVENKVILRRAQGGDSLRVWCDRDRILQVLLNLLSNAVKFTPAGGTVECSVAKSGAFVQFRITDTGEGIEPAHLPHIFDRFWQAKKNRMAGAGLGLAIVKGFVEAHGGSVDASSRLGEGSTFTFTLPRASP